MLKLKSCPQCSGDITGAVPAGLCPTCLLGLAVVATPRPDETPRSPGLDWTGLHQPEPTNVTTADHAEHDTNGTAWPGAKRSRCGRCRRCSGPWTCSRYFGHGGMGVVYRAKQRLANPEVAVKVLSDAWLRGCAAERFSGEIERSRACGIRTSWRSTRSARIPAASTSRWNSGAADAGGLRESPTARTGPSRGDGRATRAGRSRGATRSACSIATSNPKCAAHRGRFAQVVGLRTGEVDGPRGRAH